jgi:tetratricopeptide (TPR) repeat protein
VFGLIGFSGMTGREADQLALLEPFEKHYGDDWWYRTQLAFAQIELQKLDEGQRNIDAALDAYPKSAHAAHIRGHLFYELGEREAGLAFLRDWMKDYSRDGLMHVHNSWHLALWSMETGRMDDAWRIYDEALSPAVTWGPQINVATDCAAFLARAEMAGEPRQAARWRELADYSTKWFGRPGLGFVDMHTVLAYAMAGDSAALAKFIETPKGATADLLQPLARGFEAYAQGDWGAHDRRDRTPARHARTPGRQPRATRPAGIRRDVRDGESRPRERGPHDDRKAPPAERQGQGLPAGGALGKTPY